MKAIIAAGGRATRLRPITTTLNKHLIPLANKPLLWYAIEKLADVGIVEIGINVNPGETEIQKSCGDGKRWGVNLTYIEQRGGPNGIGRIPYNAREFLGEDDFIYYLGDNIILGGLQRFVDKFKSEKLSCLLALSQVKDPQRFGVPVMMDNRIVRVDEKPSNPQSNFAVTGIYVYDKNYFQAAESIAPSPRGEYEISDVHSWLIEKGFAVGYEVITGWWKDTGKPDDLLDGNQLIMTEIQGRGTESEGEIAPDARFSGWVKVGKGTRIGDNVVIRGPVIIGENSVIENSYIGPYTTIGDGVEIYNSEIEHSIVSDNSDINCSQRIVDSLIGLNSTVISASSSLPSGHRLIIGDHTMVEL